MIKIKVSNQRLWEIDQRGENIDQWLFDNVKRSEWQEWFALTNNRPYRCFSFNNEKDAILFSLRWL